MPTLFDGFASMQHTVDYLIQRGYRVDMILRLINYPAGWSLRTEYQTGRLDDLYQDRERAAVDMLCLYHFFEFHTGLAHTRLTADEPANTVRYPYRAELFADNRTENTMQALMAMGCDMNIPDRLITLPRTITGWDDLTNEQRDTLNFAMYKLYFFTNRELTLSDDLVDFDGSEDEDT